MTSTNTNRTIHLAQSAEQIQHCYNVMAQLRPHLSAEQFLQQVQQQQRSGFLLVYLEAEQTAQAVAGFRISTNLAWGTHLYVDDLVTDEKYRGSGAGGELFRWLVEFARNNGCQQLHLDSGVQRFDAHRFYLRHGMYISSHHFTFDLNPR